VGESQTAIILVTDLVGSTQRRSEVGEDAAEVLRRQHDHLLGDATVEHGGEVVKSLGDGILARFASAADAVAAAVAIQQRASGDFDVRIGISAGDVTLEDGDCFGSPVIEAARLCARAEGGQILVADLARMLARGRGGHTFTPVGALELRGLPEPVSTSEVAWEPLVTDRPAFPAGLQISGFPFAGRAETRESLLLRWKRAAEGEASTVLLSGEPGMGKTRLASELARQAHDAGGTVLFGRSDEEVTAPYRSFTEALGPLVAALSDDQLAGHVDEFAGALALVVPALTARVPDVLVPEGAPEHVRALVFDAVGDLVSRAAAAAPLLVVVDDLHWADDASLLLLRHLASSRELGRVMLLGTYRDTDLVRGHRLSSVLADLRRVDGVERIDLEGLDLDEVVDLMAAAGGYELDDRGVDLARVVHVESDGNPFFVGEILRHLAESGVIYEADGRWVSDAATIEDIGVPQGIREVLGRRLDDLPDDAVTVLRSAAVIGLEFDLAVLARTLGRDADDVIDGLDVSLERALVQEIPGQLDRFRFTHALVRQTLYEELSMSRRVRTHAKVAAACDARSNPAERAHHLLQAAGVADPAELVAAAIEAAHAAGEQHAWESADDWFDRALEAVEDLADDDPALVVDLQRARARSLAMRSDYAAARQTIVDVVPDARAVGDVDRLADLAFHYAMTGNAWLDMNDTFALGFIDEVEAMLPEGDSIARAQLLAARSSMALQSPDHDAVAGPARESVAMLRRFEAVPDSVMLLAVTNSCEALRGSPDADELLETARSVRRYGKGLEREYGRYMEMTALTKLGRIDEVEALARESIELGRRSRSDLYSWQGHGTLACVHAWHARWDDAEAEFAESSRFSEFIGDTGAAVTLFQEGWIAMLRGQGDRVRASAGRLAELVPAMNFYTPGMIDALADPDHDPAVHAAAVEEYVTDMLPVLPHWAAVVMLAAFGGSVRHADADTATRVGVLVEPSIGLWNTTAPTQHMGHGTWASGAVAEALRDLDTAVARYDEGRRIHEEAGEIPDRANKSAWLVDVLIERDGPGDAERAKQLAFDVAEAADRHQIAGLAERVTARVE
jgi:class 3 adenylate cyclase